MLDESIKLVLLDLSASLSNQDQRHILQHHRLQREAA